MTEKILIGFIGAALALILRELWEWYKCHSRRRKLATLCVEHLQQIQKDLRDHVKVNDGKAFLGETQYCEVAVGDFLYGLITSNVDLFSDIDSLRKTVTFFHHYKVNMTTVKSRMTSSGNDWTHLEEGTYKNLLHYLGEAIAELESIGGK